MGVGGLEGCKAIPQEGPSSPCDPMDLAALTLHAACGEKLIAKHALLHPGAKRVEPCEHAGALQEMHLWKD